MHGRIMTSDDYDALFDNPFDNDPDVPPHDGEEPYLDEDDDGALTLQELGIQTINDHNLTT